MALPIALNDSNQVNFLYMDAFLPANAYNNFEENNDQWGNKVDESFRQGSIGLTGDYIVENSAKTVKSPTVVV